MIKRTLVISACIVALIGVLVLPASALGVDYKDLDYQVSVDGDNNIVTLTIPKKYTRMQVRQGSSYVVNKGDTHSVSWVANSGIYLIRIYPFYDGGLSLDDIPAGSTLTFDITMKPSGGYNTPTATASWTYLDSSLGEVGWGSKDFGYAPIADTFSFEVPIQRISGAVSLNPLLYFNNFSVLEPNTSVTITVESAVLTMSISSLYFMQQQTGKTNEILTEVEKQLEANGQTLQEVLDAQQQTNDKLDDTNNKLDTIINGEVGSTPPSGGGAVGDLGDAEAGLRDDAQSGLDEGLAMQQTALEIFLQYASAFAAAGAIFEIFANIPFFSFLLYVSVAIGLFGLLLNLGVDVSLAASDAARRDRKATNRRIIRQSRRK